MNPQDSAQHPINRRKFLAGSAAVATAAGMAGIAHAQQTQPTTRGGDGLVNSTTLKAVKGDTVRIYVTNNLPVETTANWHGFVLPHGTDGVSGLEQPPIPVDETWMYESSSTGRSCSTRTTTP